MNQASELQVMRSRLDKLERHNRTLKQAALFLVVLVGSVLLMGQARTTRTIEANEFVLKDTSGRRRAVLHISDYVTPGPELVLFDENGTKRIELGIREELGLTEEEKEQFRSANGGILLFSNGRGSMQAAFGATDGEGAKLGFYGHQESTRELTLEGRSMTVPVTSPDIELSNEKGPALRIAGERGDTWIMPGSIIMAGHPDAGLLITQFVRVSELGQKKLDRDATIYLRVGEDGPSMSLKDGLEMWRTPNLRPSVNK